MLVEVKTFEEDEGIDGLGSDPFVSEVVILATCYVVNYMRLHCREVTEFLLS